MEEDRNLGTMFQAGTAWAGWAFSVTVIFLSVAGLLLSLQSFIRMYQHVRDNAGAGTGAEWPVGHIIAVILAGLLSVSGLILGFASLLWNPEAGA